MTLPLPAPSNNRHLITTLGFLSMLFMGTVYSWSVFRVPLEDGLGLSPLESGVPFLVFLSMYSFSMPFAGKWLERSGPVPVAMTGGVLMALGYILSGFASNLFWLVLSYGVVAGIGVGTFYGVPIAMASRWFPERKGMATGFVLLAFGVSPLVTAPVAALLIAGYSVQTTFMILGFFFLLVMPLMSIAFSNPPAYALRPEEPVRNFGRNLVRNKKFLSLWFVFFVVTFSGLMTIGISGPMAQDILFSGHLESALVLSFLALFNGLGRLFFGYLTDRVGLAHSAYISYGTLFLSALIMWNVAPGNVLLFLIGAALQWGVFGGWLTMAPLSVVHFFGPSGSARRYGILFTAYGVGAITGVFVSSFVKESTGEYRWAYPFVLVLSVVGFYLLRRMFPR